MPGYYHYESSRASVSKDEPVYTNLYRVTFVLPPPLRSIYGTEIITEQIKKISGLDLDKIPEPVEQKYTHISRQYAGASVDTKVNLTMEFEINVDGNTKMMYPYAPIKAWGRLQYDPSNGYMGLKRDYTGSCKIEVHMKDGTVIRRVDVPVLFLAKNLNGWDLDRQETGIATLEAEFVAENCKDQVIG